MWDIPASVRLWRPARGEGPRPQGGEQFWWCNSTGRLHSLPIPDPRFPRDPDSASTVVEVCVAQTPSSVHSVLNQDRPRKAAEVQDELLADGSMVLYHTAKRELLTLNPTAALIWECCDGTYTVPAIAAEVREVFPDRSNIDQDVIRLLHDLRERGMIVNEGP
jgi:hypothetical protein